MTKILWFLASLVMAGKIHLSTESEKYKNMFGDRFRAINSKPKLSDDEGLLYLKKTLVSNLKISSFPANRLVTRETLNQ